LFTASLTTQGSSSGLSAYGLDVRIALHLFPLELSTEEGIVPEHPIKNDLQARLSKLDLTYADIPRLCPPGMPLSIHTVRDLATGRRFGDRRSWERIRAALNAHLKSNAYDVEDLIGDTYDEYLRHWHGIPAKKQSAEAG
jgi:hypothetical protein